MNITEKKEIQNFNQVTTELGMKEMESIHSF